MTGPNLYQAYNLHAFEWGFPVSAQEVANVLCRISAPPPLRAPCLAPTAALHAPPEPFRFTDAFPSSDDIAYMWQNYHKAELEMRCTDARLLDMRRSIKEAEARVKRARGEPDVEEMWCRLPMCEETQGDPLTCAGYCKECAKDYCHHEDCLQMTFGVENCGKYCWNHGVERGLGRPTVVVDLSEEEMLEAWMQDSIIESTRSPSPVRGGNPVVEGLEDSRLREIDEFGSADTSDMFVSRVNAVGLASTRCEPSG